MGQKSRYLYIMRHGVAESQARVVDFDRALTPFGKKQIEIQERQFKLSDGIRPDCVFCSTAKRTRQTGTELQKLFQGVPFFYRETLYLAPAFRILELIRKADDIFYRILIIGHNPGLDHLIGLLNNKTCQISLKPADCVSIRLAINSWKDINIGTGQIEKIFLGAL